MKTRRNNERYLDGRALFGYWPLEKAGKAALKVAVYSPRRLASGFGLTIDCLSGRLKTRQAKMNDTKPRIADEGMPTKSAIETTSSPRTARAIIAVTPNKARTNPAIPTQMANVRASTGFVCPRPATFTAVPLIGVSVMVSTYLSRANDFPET